MDTLFWIFLAIFLSGFIAYHRLSLTLYTVSFTVLMIVGSLFNVINLVEWILFIAIAVPLNFHSIRVTHITKPLFAAFKRITPQMSTTEKEALDAGTTWFEADLFRGAPDWNKLHNIPTSRLSADEQAFLEGPVETVCQMVNDWHTTHERADLSPEVWQYLKDNKFFAMIIKKKYGGLEFCAYAQSRVLQKLTSVSSVLASTVGVPNSLGPGELLQQYGTKEQQDYYLPRLANGQEIPCFALTSPEAGSDAGAIPDKGIICQAEFEGKSTLGMKLTWNKRYITLAPVATVLGLAFKLYDPEHLLGDKEELGITCALIPTNLEGVMIGRRHFPLNVPFQNGPTQGQDVFVPLDYIIGGPDMAGQGWRMLVECLSVGRAITLPSNSTGGIKSLALATGAYSRIRRQFNLPIGYMEGIEEPLARIGGNAYLMDAVTSFSTSAIDLGEKPAVVSAISKYHLTEKMRQCVIDSMDIHGGKGICMGPNNYLARAYQGAPIAITVEGANILTRSMIIYGQGAIRCHPYVIAELEAVHNSDAEQALNDFDYALFGHIGFAISNFCKSLWFSITNANFVKTPVTDVTAKYYQQLTKFSANLAFLSDVAMLTFGGELKRRERLSARLGDILSYLYMASATLKRFNDEGRQQQDLPVLRWAVEDCLYKAEQAIDEIRKNFPNRSIKLLLKLVLMPFGKRLSKPSDKTDHSVAKLLLSPNATRDRIGHGQYLTRHPDNMLGILEQTLEDIIACEPIVNKIEQALGHSVNFYDLDKLAAEGLTISAISQQEADLLIRTEIGRKQAISVDDFDNDDLVVNKALTKKPASNTIAA